MKYNTFFFILLVILLVHFKAFGQLDKSDSGFYQTAVNNAINAYSKSETDQARIYNGRQYKPFTFPFINGSPFFLTDQFSNASIVYDGGFYDNIRLLYDEVAEMVIFSAGSRLELINDRIEKFTIAGHRFIHLKKDSIKNGVPAGFYEQLYAGNIQVFKKEKKSLKDVLSVADGYQAGIEVKTGYYIRKKGSYYTVNKKKEVLNILSDKRKEIQQLIKENKLDFRHDKENTLVAIAAYYDQLTR